MKRRYVKHPKTDKCPVCKGMKAINAQPFGYLQPCGFCKGTGDRGELGNYSNNND